MSGTILDTIIAEKHSEVAAARAAVPELVLRQHIADAPPVRSFRSALESTPGLAIIAEIKRRSPSAGPIRPDLDVAEIARQYERGGAACLSVLTDTPHFGGSLALLAEARAACRLPVLRKEFIISEYQILEARAYGADAVLLIAGVLDAVTLRTLHQLAHEVALDALMEVHTAEELDIVRAAALVRPILGINNRDLKRQAVSLDTFESLAPTARGLDALLVAESGIRTAADAARMARAGARALLVGESLLRESDPSAAVAALAAVPAEATR